MRREREQRVATARLAAGRGFRRRISIAAAVAIIAGLLGAVGEATPAAALGPGGTSSIGFDDFSDLSGLNLNGLAGSIAQPVSVNGHPSLRVLRSVNNERSSVFWKQPIELAFQGVGSSFSEEFTFRIVDNRGSGAEWHRVLHRPIPQRRSAAAAAGSATRGSPTRSPSSSTHGSTAAATRTRTTSASTSTMKAPEAMARDAIDKCIEVMLDVRPSYHEPKLPATDLWAQTPPALPVASVSYEVIVSGLGVVHPPVPMPNIG
jgi:hypothetical protein